MEFTALSPPSLDGSVPITDSKDATAKPTAPVSALTPPTSEDMNTKVDDSGSELSDVELDEEDAEEITPDHYYEGGKIPVFKPVRTYWRLTGTYDFSMHAPAFSPHCNTKRVADNGAIPQLQELRREN